MRFLPIALAILTIAVLAACLHAQNASLASSTPVPAEVVSCTANSTGAGTANISSTARESSAASASDAKSADQSSKQPSPTSASAQTPDTSHGSAVNNCVPASTQNAVESTEACAKSELVEFAVGYDNQPVGTVPIWRKEGNNAFFYESGMTIDADGAPNAYHPDNIGLDDLANAGGPGDWPGLAKDHNGDPIIQGPNDPYPGYYVSATALSDRDKPFNDPTRYVDATKIPFIVLPGNLARQAGARTGDFAVVFNLRNGKSSPAIFADVGPLDHLGEGSIALAANLGIRSDARNGGTRGQVAWLVFAGSGNGRPRTIDDINSEANRLLNDWGGSARMNACMADDSSAQ